MNKRRAARLSTVPLVALLAAFEAVAGVENGDLRFTVTVDRTVVAPGEPIVVNFSWKNVGTSATSMLNWRGPTTGVTELRREASNVLYDFAIHAEDGSRLDYKGPFACGILSSLELAPGQLLSRSYDISQSYDLSRPGKYVLKAAYLRALRAESAVVGLDDLLIHPDVVIEVKKGK